MSVPGRSLKIKQSCNCEKLDKYIFFFFFLEYLVIADKSLQTFPLTQQFGCALKSCSNSKTKRKYYFFFGFASNANFTSHKAVTTASSPHTEGSEYRHQVTIKLRFSTLKYKGQSKHKLFLLMPLIL